MFRRKIVKKKLNFNFILFFVQLENFTQFQLSSLNNVEFLKVFLKYRNSKFYFFQTPFIKTNYVNTNIYKILRGENFQ